MLLHRRSQHLPLLLQCEASALLQQLYTGAQATRTPVVPRATIMLHSQRKGVTVLPCHVSPAVHCCHALMPYHLSFLAYHVGTRLCNGTQRSAQRSLDCSNIAHLLSLSQEVHQ